jgi:hypothetical protein
MLRILVLSVLLLAGVVQGARADEEAPDPPLCPNWSVNVETDLVLWQALGAAHPSAKVDYGWEGSDDLQCLFPYKVLSYESFMVLIMLSGEPGEACHGCAARASAVFLQRDGRSLKVMARHDGFTESGTFGGLMAIDAFRLGSQNGLVIEGGGTFQGYSFGVLSPFLILNGRMQSIGPENGIPSGDSNCGARSRRCRDVSGFWRTEADRLVVHYHGKRENGALVKGGVAYELRKGSLVRVSGHRLAAEMEVSRP